MREFCRMPVTNRKPMSVPLFSEHLVLAAPTVHAPYRPGEGVNQIRDRGFIFVSPSVSKTFHDRVLQFPASGRAQDSPRASFRKQTKS